jgi:hypothetical protein
MAIREENNFSDFEQQISAALEGARPSAARPPTSRPAVNRRTTESRRTADLPWNVLTVLVWLVIAFSGMAFFSIYSNPHSPLNPLRAVQAPTLVAAVVIPTMTPSPQPTATDPSADITPLATRVLPTATLTPTATLEPTETATPGPSPTATVYSLYPFVQRGEIKVIDGATFPDHDTCRLWVAGQAYDLQGAPMVGITVMMGGVLDRKPINQLSLTGTALQYGQAGYEFTMADQPVRSKQSVWVQLFDQSMVPLSSRVFFDTHEDCALNLNLINFRQVR